MPLLQLLLNRKDIRIKTFICLASKNTVDAINSGTDEDLLQALIIERQVTSSLSIKSTKFEAMYSSHFSVQELKQTDLVDYLEKLGHQSKKIRNNDYWYLSPLRDEKTPSFKVNRKLNVWYDFRTGQGGNIIDFGILYHHCTVTELLKKLSENFSFHPQTQTVQQPQSNTQKAIEALELTIKVIAAKPLTHPALCRYLDIRKIPFEIANGYCKEVELSLTTRPILPLDLKIIWEDLNCATSILKAVVLAKISLRLSTIMTAKT